jgi:hypothetical protein
LGNIYESGSQTYCLKGKTYRDVQLGEHIHSIVVEHTPEHEVIYGSEPTGRSVEKVRWPPPGGATATVMGCSLLLRPLPMMRGTRGACHGSNVQNVDEAGTSRTTKNLLPGELNVEVVL